MRQVTLQIAFDPGGWSDDRRHKIEELFDSLAPTWPTDDTPDGTAPVVEVPLTDALDRGLPLAPPAERNRAIDLGGGNGRATGYLLSRFPDVALTDLSFEMLTRVRPGLVPRVQADSSQLPFRSGSVDVLMLANMFLFPSEAARVVAPQGVVIWVNSWGPNTPIHLTAQEVDEALPGDWSGVAANAGDGTWSVHWRSTQLGT